MKRNRKFMLGATAALLAAAGGGVAIAASDSPSEENQAVINDAAKQLGLLAGHADNSSTKAPVLRQAGAQPQ